MKKLSRLNRGIIAVVLICIVLAAISFSRPKDLSLSVYHTSQWNDISPEIERALSSPLSSEIPSPVKHVYGLVVSHHVPQTVPLLVEYYNRLKSQKVTKFIIIGPDHIDGGENPATVSNAVFSTVYGELKPIEGLAQALEGMKVAKIEELPFEQEHSIGSQVIVINRIFPEVQIMPIIIRSDATPSHMKALAEALAPFIDEETVVVASIDFSHYLPTSQALPIDKVSGEILKNLDADAAHLIKADSDKSALLFIELMKLKDARITSDVRVLNTNDVMQNSDYTTGYVFGYWGKVI